MLGGGQTPPPNSFWGGAMTSYRWINSDQGVEYTVTMRAKGWLPRYSPEMLPKLQRKELSAQSTSQQIELQARGCLTLKAISHKDSCMLAQITLNLSHFAFLIERKRHEQISRLFPQSLSRHGALALVLPSQLIERFRLLPSDSLPQSWMRRLLTLMQCSVPETSWTTHRANESDTFGRYIALYDLLESRGSRVVLHKRRSRYVYIPQQRTTSGVLALKCMPFDRKWQIVLDDMGLASLQIESETQIVSQSSSDPLVQERIEFSLHRSKKYPLSVSDRSRLLTQWDDRSRVEVMPWQPVEASGTALNP